MQPVDMTECGPVHRLANTNETPNGDPLTAIDMDTNTDVWETTPDGVKTWAWQRPGTNEWVWEAFRFGQGISYVDGIGCVTGHAPSREIAIARARAAAVLVGTEP